MKKITAAMLLTAALSAGTAAFAQTGTNPTGQVDPATAQTQNQKPAELKDVPAGHWASAAIQVAANCGIIRGFPDGTFRGNEPVTRYQAAAIIARLLDAVRNGECGIPKYATKAEMDKAIADAIAGIKPTTPGGQVIDTSKFLTAADLVVLQNAIQELAADLAQLGVRVAELEDNAVTADDLARVEEISTQARDLAEAAAAAAQEASDSAATAIDAAAGAQQTADAAGEAADAANAAAAAAQQTADDALAAAANAQQTADDALAAGAAAQQTADDAAAGVEVAQQSADDAINAAANAQQAADDAMAVAMAAQEAADEAAAAAATAQQTADDALAAAAAAQQTGDDAMAAAAAAQQTADDALAGIEVAQQTADDALAAAANAQQTGDDAMAAAANAQQTADDALVAADDALAAAAAAQQSADDAAAAIEVAQQTADDALDAAANAQLAADDAMAAAAAAMDEAAAATAAAEVAQQTADDALALAQEAQPAGDYATNDDLAGVAETANQARDLAEAVAAALENLPAGVDPTALQDLADQVEATSIAADTALAQARELQDRYDELNGRIDDLESQLGELGATVEGQADSIAALNDLVVLLNQDVLSLQDRVTQLERGLSVTNGALDDLAATAASQEDLESLREFTTLLRRDQTALADRVGELEARVGRVENRVTAVEGRVTDLEKNAFTIGGTISLTYNTARVWRDAGGNIAANDFDIDRLGLTGVGFAGSNTGTADFGTGNPVTNGLVRPITGANGGVSGASGVRTEGWLSYGLTLNFTFRPRNLIEASKDWNTYPNFNLVLQLTEGGTYGFNEPSNGFGYYPAVRIQAFQSLFNVGNAPLLINFGVSPAFTFSDYAFKNTSGRGAGFVAALSGAGLLPFDPALTVVYGSKNGSITTLGAASANLLGTASINRLIVGSNGDARVQFGAPYTTGIWLVTVVHSNGTTTATFDPVGAGSTTLSLTGIGTITSITVQSSSSTSGVSGNAGNGDFLYFGGIRGTASLIPGFTGGIYYAYQGGDVLTPAQPNTVTTLYGLNFGGKLFGLLDVKGELNKSDNPTRASGAAAFVQVGANLDPFTIAANYRFVDPQYDGLGADGQYAKNQMGFGIDVGVKNLLGFLTLGAYFDSRSAVDNTQGMGNGPKQATIVGASRSATNFGINAGFRLIGFDFTTSFDSWNEADAGGVAQAAQTLFILRADHDGSKAGALIGGLNLALGLTSRNESAAPNGGPSSRTVLYAYASTKLGLAGFNIEPEAYFASQNSSGAGGLLGTDSITTFGAGVTATGDFLFGSKITLGLAYDQASHTVPSFTASTGWVLVGLNWAIGPFGAPSTFGIQFASRTDTARNGTGFGPSFAAPNGIGSWGGDSTAAGGNVSGLYGNFGYYGLNFQYGIFALTDFALNQVIWGQRFRITYALKF